MVLTLAFAAALAAAPLVNEGKPMRVSAACTDEEIHALGLPCTEEEPCPLYLELASVEGVGNKIFVSGNLHTPVTTVSSILLASEDNGKTWDEPHPRIRSGVLEHIQFLDFQRGWVSGQLLLTLPRDPFFLLTTDGGKTWRRREIFSESRPGAIEHFWFDSQTSGTVLIDRSQSGESSRYEVYESMTGGESWMVRQVSSKPIQIKRPAPAAEPALRLRPDAASKAYRIERRQGQKWEPVASFLVEAGECKPAPAAPREKPPEPALEPEPVKPPPSAAPPAAPRKPPTLKRPPAPRPR